MIHKLQILLLAATCTGLCAQSTPFPSVNQKQPEVIDDASIWSHFGGNTRRQSTARLSPNIPTLASPTWIALGDGTTTYIPIAQTGLVVDRSQVYTLATNPAQPGSSFAVAYNRFTGSFIWATPIPAAILDSWSTPAIDIQHQQIIIAISNQLIAIDTTTGAQNWSTPINGIVVNASPVITSDLRHNDRAFITNYSFGGGNASKLTCINTDPFHLTQNPFQPGEIVWQASLSGDSSGNTPAYADGIVFVATASGSSSQAGLIHAFDAAAITAPSPTWTFTNTINAGFFSGVSIAKGHVYASSYNFSGLQFNSNTVKVNKHTGQLAWSVPTNRTDATPIVLPSGDVIVSGGVPISTTDALPFFGSLPSIQYIDETNDNSASVLWDSATDTLDDANTNGYWDRGESFLSLGGWTHQPIAFILDNTPMLLVGTLPETTITNFISHNTDIALIDLTKLPTDPNFIVEQYAGTGSTPAMLGSWIYTPGANGIHAFAPTPLTPLQLMSRYTKGQITIDQLIDQLHR
ncbi:MAG: PQQ-binding-like beta-propeller repeat protein [Phycisphaerales bacterium]|nr:PQQ-binding-like beta-propeller repeat protein [Phycisphaerales bacterium]